MTDARSVPLRITVDPRKNTLELEVVGFGWTGAEVSDAGFMGTLDVGVRGQLIGIEIGDQYLPISDPGRDAEDVIRSVEIPVKATRGPDGTLRTISFQRTGVGYEISFPSGNQCWNIEAGDGQSRQVCSVVIG